MPTQTATKQLVVCLPAEPPSLYLYAEPNASSAAILAAIYAEDFVTLSYTVQPLGLEKVPALADGDAAVRLVPVNTGDKVVNNAGDVITLTEGDQVMTADNTLTTFDGSTLVMEQIVVDFILKQRYWADGKPVTADDSVYSFELAAHPDTPGDKWVIDRTSAYQATGNLRTRWVGLPGFHHSGFATSFWQPAPRHLWGDRSPLELRTASISSKEPLGDGPFKITSWVAGEMIRLERNPYYYRSSEGLPRLDSVTFLFEPNLNKRLSRLLAGTCDIVPRDGLERDLIPFFAEAEASEYLQPIIRPGAQRIELLLGINSSGGYGDGIGRPDWFEDQRFRQATALCIDRTRIVDEIAYGRSPVSNNFVPIEHPLYTNDVARWPYDPVAANNLLDDLGMIDTTGDGIREDAATGAALDLTVLVNQQTADKKLAALITANLAGCGMNVVVQALPAGEMQDVVHGRRFDLAIISSPATLFPDCDRFASWQIPDAPITPPAGTIMNHRDTNVTGWSDPAYDAICAGALRSLPGTSTHITDHHQAQRLYAVELPSIPLFLNPQITVSGPDVLHLTNDPSVHTDLWNLFALDVAPDN
jgi:peptide/nickel transport system substrate-binding protein